MPKLPFPYSELAVGQPLPFDAYSSAGTLLLRRGFILTSEAQIRKLRQQATNVVGVAGDASMPRVAMVPTTATEESPQVSPLALIVASRQRLHLLYTAKPAADFPLKLARIVDIVQQVCRVSPDLALASILMHREGLYTIRHAINVAIVCQILGIALELTPLELSATVTAALTMNIGMFELQQKLHAMAGPLTEEQRAEVEAHCERGVGMLIERGLTDALGLGIVRDHHERPDGDGYPAGKKVDALDVPTQLLGLADVYCARVSSRDYRPAMLSHVALRWLFLNEGVTFGQRFSAMFVKALGVYPPGTGVRLRDGTIAVVTHRGALSHRPTVSAIVTSGGERPLTPIRRVQESAEHAISEVVDLDALQLTVAMEALWGPDARI